MVDIFFRFLAGILGLGFLLGGLWGPGINVAGIVGGLALVLSAVAFGSLVNSVRLTVSQGIGLAALVWHAIALGFTVPDDDSAVFGIVVTALAAILLAYRVLRSVRQGAGGSFS